jgi:hypothetical protein
LIVCGRSADSLRTSSGNLPKSPSSQGIESINQFKLLYKQLVKSSPQEWLAILASIKNISAIFEMQTLHPEDYETPWREYCITTCIITRILHFLLRLTPTLTCVADAGPRQTVIRASGTLRYASRRRLDLATKELWSLQANGNK